MDFQKLDRARIAAALAAAVITGGAALYGVYQKSREATAASYETLAPEVNELKANVEQLRQENQRLREALARGGTRVAPVEPAGSGPTAGRAAPRRPRATTPAAPAPAGTADAGAVAPANPPPAEEPPAPAEDPEDVIGDLKNRVPIDFEKAIRVWKDVQEIRKKQP
jgi:hypothetical protein